MNVTSSAPAQSRPRRLMPAIMVGTAAIAAQAEIFRMSSFCRFFLLFTSVS